MQLNDYPNWFIKKATNQKKLYNNELIDKDTKASLYYHTYQHTWTIYLGFFKVLKSKYVHLYKVISYC